jgi:ParB family chromosome partitioning protein
VHLGDRNRQVHREPASGLSMLLGNAPSESSGARLLQIPVDAIERNEAQPRTRFEASAIAALAESIAASGVIQPIAVRELRRGRFEIVAGERRWLASQQAGLTTIPAVVHDVDERDSLVLALAENLVREDLNPLETARAYAALIDEFQMTAADLARTLGRPVGRAGRRNGRRTGGRPDGTGRAAAADLPAASPDSLRRR